MDYGRVKPDRFFWMIESGKLLGLAAVLGILFYDAWYAGAFVLLLAPFLIRQDVEKYRKNVIFRKKCRENDFSTFCTKILD